MLYVDTSALAKRYIGEAGSDALRARLWRTVNDRERIFTSFLTYAEMLTLFGRRYQTGEFRAQEFQRTMDEFLHDWLFAFDVLELDARTMNALRDLTPKYPLKSADAVHLSTALWLRDNSRLVPEVVDGDLRMEFAVADKSLARIAAQCGLSVFNPEEPEQA